MQMLPLEKNDLKNLLHDLLVILAHTLYTLSGFKLITQLHCVLLTFAYC